MVDHPMSHHRGCIGQYINLPKRALRVGSHVVCLSNGTGGRPSGIRCHCLIGAGHPVPSSLTRRLNVDGRSVVVCCASTSICGVPLARGTGTNLLTHGSVMIDVRGAPTSSTKNLCPLGVCGG